jgi:hypothetical protein
MAKTCKSAEAAALVATAALLLAVLGERPTLAREQGTEQERKACMPDVFRLCAAEQRHEIAPCEEIELHPLPLARVAA